MINVGFGGCDIPTGKRGKEEEEEEGKQQPGKKSPNA